MGRSREGAWIEIAESSSQITVLSRRSREGAWIEIVGGLHQQSALKVAPARERGLKYIRPS